MVESSDDKKKVLIIDDNYGTAYTTQQFMLKYDMDADYCLNFAQSINMLETKKYDYAIVDLIINGDSENGFVIYDFLKKNYPDIKVIFITGCNKDSFFAKKAESLSHIIYKNFSPKKLAIDLKNGVFDEEEIANVTN